MKQLVLNGLTTKEAARIACEFEEGAANLIPKATPLLRAVDATDDDGVVISLDGPRAMIKSLERAALMLDGAACERLVGKLLDDHAVMWVWNEVLVPVLSRAGNRWEQEQRGIEVEHVLSAAVEHQLRVVHGRLQEAQNAKPVLLAAAPHELHTLPLYGIAAALAETGISSRVLGARVPSDALVASAARMSPCAVVVWSHQRGTADEGVWDELVGPRSNMVLMAAGPGWTDELPEQVSRANSFADCLVTLVAAAGRS
jgi:methanogenic corrinoid protein MtbC1